MALHKKSDKFKWNFKREKKNLRTQEAANLCPLLEYPDPQKPYQLETNVSDLAIGAILRILTLEGNKLIAYES